LLSSTFAISSWGNGVVAITAGLLAQVASGRLMLKMTSFMIVLSDENDAVDTVEHVSMCDMPSMIFVLET
jgi:hypothetical protein